MDVIARLRTAAQEARSRVAAEASAAGALPRDRCRLQALRRAAQGGGGATELRGGTVGPGLVDLLAELTRRGILRCAHGRDRVRDPQAQQGEPVPGTAHRRSLFAQRAGLRAAHSTSPWR